MAVVNQIQAKQTVYIQKETTNKSFIDMHYYLKRTGRVNNNFFLVLYDPGLAGVDPKDPLLTTEMKARVLRECLVNYWYFLREVVRIPIEGGTAGSGVRYRLDRGSLAMNFLFTLNYNMFVELPRQFGKTTTAVCRYLWVYQFGTSNSSMMFIHKDHGGSKNNLKKLKELRDNLPSYLQMSSATGMNGKKLKVPDTVVAIEHPFNHNKITTFASARSKDQADKLGRGATMAIQYYDEFAFMMYNQYAYLAAMPAFSTASKNAKSNHAPYGVLITTTPGDLSTDHGLYAFNMRNKATQFNEAYYDYTYEKLEELYAANIKSSFFLIRYTYQQLGEGPEYFSKMCKELENDWGKIRREVLLEWSEASDNCPYTSQDLEIIKQWVREPIRQILFGRAGQYTFDVFEDLDPRDVPIIGVDVSGATYHDSSAVTVISSMTTKVTANFHCNFIPMDDLADLIYVLVKQYMPSAIINVEVNGGFGKSVVQRLKKTSVKRNLYYEIKERVIEETLDNNRINKVSKLCKVYGLNSTKDIRARLIEILDERVFYHKDKFIAPVLHAELCKLEVKKSGKVEHADNYHDDNLFSYLMALYVWYDGKNLMENFGIHKTTIKTDDNEDIEDFEDGIEAAKGKDIDILDKDIDEDDIILQEQQKFLEESAKIKLGYMYNNELYTQELEQIDMKIKSDPVFRQAYNEKYNTDVSNTGIRSFITIPEEAFLDDEILDNREKNKNGNLSNMFNLV